MRTKFYILHFKQALFLWIIFQIFLPTHLYGQIPQKGKRKARVNRTHIVTADTFRISSLKASVLVDSASIDSRKGLMKSEPGDIYEKLQSLANQRKLTRELSNIIIVPVKKKNSDTLLTQQSEEPFMNYSGKIIRKIRLQKIDVFGPTVYDTTLKASSWVERTANNVHRNTNDQIIRKNLLLRSGQKVDPVKMADNERLLRDLPFIEDARIYVVQPENAGDSVDVVVITKDVFSTGFDFDVTSSYSGKLGVWDKNIFSRGDEINNYLHWNSHETRNLGFEGTYLFNNILGSFVDSKISYINLSSSKTFGIDVTKNFITPTTRYAGGFSFYRNSELQSISTIDTTSKPVSLRYNYYDAWLGRSFYLNPSNYLQKSRINLILAGRAYRTVFLRRPIVTNDSLYQYYNKKVYLFSMGISRQNFYKSNLIYSFGRTEDIPYGMLIKATAGFEDNEFLDRFYSGLSLSNGRFINGLGYSYFSLDFGGFFNKNIFEQGLIQFTNHFFSNLYVVGRTKLRSFIDVIYLHGLKRYKDEYISLEDMDGIEGLKGMSLRGNKKLTMHFETVAFLPYFLYEFRFAPYIFTDMGFIGPSNVLIFNNNLYTGIGVGVRIRNERLVFKTIQFRFSFYPFVPDHVTRQAFEFSSEDRYQPNNFFMKEPEILKY